MSLLRVLSCVVLVALTAMAGCATTGGAIGNLIPAPKFLKGEIEGGIYTAKDKSFSVAVPQRQDSYEYKYMQVKEQYFENGAYVSFGPAALDQTIYRLETERLVTAEGRAMTFDDFALRGFDSFIVQLQARYGTLLELVESRPDTINGRKAHYCNLTQTVAPGILIVGESAVLEHEVFAVDFEDRAAIVWVQVLQKSAKPSLQARDFAASLVLR